MYSRNILRKRTLPEPLRGRRQKILSGISAFGLVVWLFSCAQPTPRPSPSVLSQPENIYAHALNLYRSENYLEAMKTLKALVSEYPDHPQSESANLIIGLSWLKASKPEKAKKYLQMVMQSETNLADFALYFFSQAQIETGELSAADKNLRALENLFPWSPYVENAVFNRAKIGEQLRQYSQTIKLVRQLLEQYPQSSNRAEYLMIHARVAVLTGQFQDAEQSIRELWIHHPLSPFVEDAESLSEKVPEIDWSPSFEERYQQALLTYLAGDLDLAEEKFRKLLDEIPEEEYPKITSSTYYRLGMIQYRRRRYPDCRLWLKKALSVPGLPPEIKENALLYIGKSYARGREPGAAEEYYRELLEQFSGGNAADEALYHLGRIKEDQESFEQAIHIFQQHLQQFPFSEFRNDILWQIGWHFYREQKYPEAIEYFSKIPNTQYDPINALQSSFWQARSLIASGQPDRGLAMLNDLVEKYPLTYYGFLSTMTIHSQHTITVPHIQEYLLIRAPHLVSPNSLVANTQAELLSPDARFHLRRAIELTDLQLFPEANRELSYLLKQLSVLTPELLLPIGTELVRMEYYHRLLSITEGYFASELWGKPVPENRIVWEFAHPRGWRQLMELYYPKYLIDPNLVFALVREESRFNPEARSPAGAIGLMQIMPSTGKDIARRLRLKRFAPTLLFDPETNVKCGVFYLHHLLEKFNGNIALALGAYNAGPHNMRRWLGEKSDLDPFEFIEDIPFPETNNYIKKVLQSYIRYSYLYPDSEYPVTGSVF